MTIDLGFEDALRVLCQTDIGRVKDNCWVWKGGDRSCQGTKVK